MGVFWLPTDPARPTQYRLRTFYIGAYVHLVFEALAALIWIIQMGVLKGLTERISGAQYRLTNVLMLFHLGTPIAMLGIVQQAQNNNSVLWWTFFAFLMGLAGDLETVLEIAIQNVSQTTGWAWRFVLALGIINLTLTSFAVIWYIVWRRALPTPVMKKKEQRSLLNYY